MYIISFIDLDKNSTQNKPIITRAAISELLFFGSKFTVLQVNEKLEICGPQKPLGDSSGISLFNISFLFAISHAV
jgi:hypothetical protein